MKMDWDPITHYKDVAVAERYDRERFSGLPGRIFNALERRALRRAFARLPRSMTILDLPCGTGRLAETLLEEGFHVVGADISAAMLDVAQRKLERFGSSFETRVGDVRELARQEQASYDAALCARVLMHFPLEQQVEFLKSVAVLAKGTVVFSQSLSTPYQRMRRGIKRILGHAPPAVYPITESQLRSLLRGAGLREVRRHRISRLLSEGIYVVTEHLQGA
jgi:2-polyprenyl-3-methyl-5-hydroxy-6-metoxy-1,4-benzoquinol methylase